MNLLKWIFLILLFSSSKSYSQINKISGCWEAHTNYKDVKFTDNPDFFCDGFYGSLR